MKQRILELIKNTDWVVLEDQENIKFLQVYNGKRKLGIYYSTMTVVTQDMITRKQDVVRNANLETLRIMLGVRTSFVKRFGEYMRNLGK